MACADAPPSEARTPPPPRSPIELKAQSCQELGHVFRRRHGLHDESTIRHVFEHAPTKHVCYDKSRPQHTVLWTAVRWHD